MEDIYTAYEQEAEAEKMRRFGVPFPEKMSDVAKEILDILIDNIVDGVIPVQTARFIDSNYGHFGYTFYMEDTYYHTGCSNEYSCPTTESLEKAVEGLSYGLIDHQENEEELGIGISMWMGTREDDENNFGPVPIGDIISLWKPGGEKKYMGAK